MQAEPQPKEDCILATRITDGQMRDWQEMMHTKHGLWKPLPWNMLDTTWRRVYQILYEANPHETLTMEALTSAVETIKKMKTQGITVVRDSRKNLAAKYNEEIRKIMKAQEYDTLATNEFGYKIIDTQVHQQFMYSMTDIESKELREESRKRKMD